MKRFFVRIVCIFLAVHTIQLMGQTTTEYKRKWLFGLNCGAAWENADVRSKLGSGWGLTLEKEIIANNTNTFGFSLRGRYLHTRMRGIELTPYYGVANDNNLNGIVNPSINYTANRYVYRNYSTKTNEFSLEGLLILNRLRANSKFKIYGFGGIAATGYLSKINQLDSAGNMYNYSSVSTNGRSLTRRDLNSLWDKSYETNGVAGQSRNSYVLSGAIGIGFGIKVSPNVYVGWEHKYTFTSTDYLDASKYHNDGTKSMKNDKYHYTSLFLNVTIGSGSSHVENPPLNKTYYPTPTTIQKPVITLQYPRQNPIQLQDCYAYIKVGIINITSINQVSVLVNGNTLPVDLYTFDAGAGVLAINAPIYGNSIFSIIAQNSSGSDTKYVYTNCFPTYTPPIQNPAPVIEEQIIICHKNVDGTRITQSIIKSQWPSHSSHGDYFGTCKNVDIPVKNGNPTPTPISSQVEETIIICHKNEDGSIVTQTILQSQLADHLGHGDHVGACTDIPVKNVGTTPPLPTSQPAAAIIICHKNADGTMAAITILKEQLAIHLSHGDHVGACTDADIPVKNGGRIPPPTTSQQEETVMICHKNVDGSIVTRNIVNSQLAMHLAHGDHLGACTDADIPVKNVAPIPPSQQPDATIVICHRNADGSVVTRIILNNQLAMHLSHGDHVGSCTDADIPMKKLDPILTTPPAELTVVICHRNGDGSVGTRTIVNSQLGMHLAHGDHVGACTYQDIPVRKENAIPPSPQIER